MKKALSIAMALIMMFAICVPAFAGELNVSTQEGDALVITDMSAIEGDGYYTVTYPATLTLVWGTTITPFNYSVTSQLKTGKVVYVTVMDKEIDFYLKNSSGGKMAYGLGGDCAVTTSAPVVTDETFTFSVQVPTSEWSAAAYDTYQDILSFKASITDAQ